MLVEHYIFVVVPYHVGGKLSASAGTLSLWNTIVAENTHRGTLSWGNTHMLEEQYHGGGTF